MIFVAAGTQDGRELAGFLLEKGQSVTASVVSRYGEELLSRYPGIVINDRPLDEAALAEYCRAHGVAVFVNACARASIAQGGSARPRQHEKDPSKRVLSRAIYAGRTRVTRQRPRWPRPELRQLQGRLRRHPLQ